MKEKRLEIKITSDYAEIIIKKRNKVYKCIIDAEDVEKLNNISISIAENNYFVCSVNKKTMYLSRFLLLEEIEEKEKLYCKKLVVDHIDNNIFNNRKSNLRVLNYSANRFFSSTKNENTGIFCKENGYCVQLGLLNIGTFKTLEEAREVRKIAENIVYKGDLKMNFEYVNYRKHKKIMDAIIANKNFFSDVVEYDGKNYCYKNGNLMQIVKNNCGIKIIIIKILREEIARIRE